MLKKAGQEVITPVGSADSLRDKDWCFQDNAHGILEAVAKGANTLWANTILFASHPLQTSEKLPHDLRIVGQPPLVVEKYDDKAYTNDLLRKTGLFTLPQCWIITSQDKEFFETEQVVLPVIAKPIRGRGSHGVKLCKDVDALKIHALDLFNESPEIMVEQYLSGEEATITVMPPGTHPDTSNEGYWSLPVVTRFNHDNGVAPYNGVVAVLSNSRVLSEKEYESDPAYQKICSECEQVAELLQTTAPIRIDVRRLTEDARAPFAMFDINMKPNMTGPGRPGREDQASLTIMAAETLGWSYQGFLLVILRSARQLDEIRKLG